MAPVALDEPLRLQDGFGGIIIPGGGGGSGGGGGRDGEQGDRGRSIRGRKGIQGPIGATGAQQPVGAAWINLVNTLPINLPVNAVPRMISGSYLIKEVTILTEGGVGSCTVKIWKANFSAHYPPIVTDDITGGANVVLSSGTTYDDSTLSGWTTTLVQGDVLLFSLTQVSGFSYVQIQLRLG